MEALNLYEITYPATYYDETVKVLKTAKTASAARYAEYLIFSDCDPDKSFADYLKMVKVRKVGQSAPKRNEPPYLHQDRIENVNSIIRKIGSLGRHFLYSEKHERFATFHWADGNLWLVDDYTDRPLLMSKSIPGEHYHFSHGGTMWGLVCDFRDYILGDDDANHNNGYGGLYCPHWGYPDDAMEFIREYAKSIGYLKPRV